MSDPYPYIQKNNRIAGNHSPKHNGSNISKGTKDVPNWPGKVQRPPPKPPAYLMGAGGELIANDAYVPPDDEKSKSSASPPPPKPKTGARLSLITGNTPREYQSQSKVGPNSPMVSLYQRGSEYTDGVGNFSPIAGRSPSFAGAKGGGSNSRYDFKSAPSTPTSSNISGTEIDSNTGMPTYVNNVSTVTIAPSKISARMGRPVEPPQLSAFEKNKLLAIQAGETAALGTDLNGVTYERYDKRLSRYVDQRHIPPQASQTEEEVPVGPENPVKDLGDGTWSACWDESASAVYYYNNMTGEASWIKPEEVDL